MILKVYRSTDSDEILKSFMRGCFKMDVDPTDYRYDYLYCSHDVEGQPESFTTIQEDHSNTAILRFGGSFKENRGYTTLKNFHEMMADLGQNYKYLVASVWNENYSMLKILLAYKFCIVGTRKASDGRTFVEFMKDMEA